MTDFDNFDEESQENIIDNIRRKSCEGDSYGHLTNFQKKANLLSFDNFQTRYLQKKIEMQRYLLEMDKERTKSTIISSNSQKNNKKLQFY